MRSLRATAYVVLCAIGVSCTTGSSDLALAQAVTVSEGKIVILAADPSDVVIQLDKNGRCGSAYFHVQRTSQNFREMTALAMTAFSGGNTIALFVVGCAGDRNLISHGYAGR